MQLVKELHKGADSVSQCCRVFGIKRNSYYKSRRCTRLVDATLILKVKACFNRHKRRYGRRHLKVALLTEYDLDISSRRLNRLMKEQQLITVWQGRKHRRVNQSQECMIYPNSLDRQFAVDQANSAWVSDLTYIWTQEGWLYLAAVIDLYSRKIIGFAMGNSPNAELVCRALQMAISVRQPPAGLMIHNDQGCQYTSKLYHALVKKYQFSDSMSRRGNCWDNAVMERFFRSLKQELVWQHSYRRHREAQQSISGYILDVYNSNRLHSTLNYLSPNMFEASKKVETI